MRGTGAPLDRKSVWFGSWGYGFPEYRTPMRQRFSFSFDVFDRKIHATESAPERRNISKPQEVFDDGRQSATGTQRTMLAHPQRNKVSPTPTFIGQQTFLSNGLFRTDSLQ